MSAMRGAAGACGSPDRHEVRLQARATQDANRAASNKMPPLWALAAIVVLGFNEVMSVLRSPLLLVRGIQQPRLAILLLLSHCVSCTLPGQQQLTMMHLLSCCWPGNARRAHAWLTSASKVLLLGAALVNYT